jgi:hypothetical protein
MPYLTPPFPNVKSKELSAFSDPIWPEVVEKVSMVPPDDPYDQPRNNTPVGWAQTVLAHGHNEYPEDPKRTMPDWHGEPDGKKNVLLWAADTPLTLPTREMVS